MDNSYHLIGIDGGASKVSVWHTEVQNNTVSLGSISSTISYEIDAEFLPGFKPIDITTQLEQMHSVIQLTDFEKQQGGVILRSCASAIAEVVQQLSGKPILIGMGFPGLKTVDGRGIAALANGPRMPDFCNQLESQLHEIGVRLVRPIARIGSDADYCGIGEEYGDMGCFNESRNAYYLGGGTGAADAIKLRGKLLPFDTIKGWLLKSWEMKNAQGVSLEKYASAGGIQWVYAHYYTLLTMDDVQRQKLYPDKLLLMAVQGDPAAIDTFDDISTNLAMLLFERMTTVYTGWMELFECVNPNRPIPEISHPYRGILLDRIVIGQRLGTLIDQSRSSLVLWKQLLANLTHLIMTYEGLSSEFVQHYCPGNKFDESRIVTSQLREAPVLGAAMDAYLGL